MQPTTGKYTTKLGAGLTLIDDTLSLLGLWKEGMSAPDLFRIALDSGLFNSVTTKRLKNIVNDCFAPRYLVDHGAPAKLLLSFLPVLSRNEIVQLMFVFTCRANLILGDFVREVYWPAYASGRETITNYMARDFVRRAMAEGKTNAQWSDTTVQNASGYLTGACGEFGLLEGGQRFEREIRHYWIDPNVALILAYDLHLSGLGDNAVVASPDWGLFGLEKFDVVETLRRAAVKGGLIIQNAGEAVSISWKHKSMEELEVACDWR